MSMSKQTLRIVLFLIMVSSALLAAQQPTNPAPTAETCKVPQDEVQVMISSISDRQPLNPVVVVTKAFVLQPSVSPDVTPDVQADLRTKGACEIEPFDGGPHVFFLSAEDLDFLLKTYGWAEFHKRYGNTAALLKFSRVGFNADRTIAFLAVRGSVGPLTETHVIVVFDKRQGRWTKKYEKVISIS